MTSKHCAAVLRTYRQKVAHKMGQFTWQDNASFRLLEAVMKSTKEAEPDRLPYARKPFLTKEAGSLTAKAAILGRRKCQEAVRTRRAPKKQLRRDEEANNRDGRSSENWELEEALYPPKNIQR